jgi:hypothetical protein
MSESPKAPPPPKEAPSLAKPRRSRKRWLLYAVAGVGALTAAALYYLRRDHEPEEDADEAHRPTHAVYEIKKKDPPKLGLEYHFDRNAIADSRVIGNQLVALTSSGNLVTLDGETFAARKERVLRRRATCLGPADQTHLVAGISNGVLVRIAAQDLAIERIGQVPGVPRWIGIRSKDGAFVTAYQPERRADSSLLVTDEGQGRTYDLGVRPVLFLDSKDRLWVASGDKIRSIDLLSGSHNDRLSKASLSTVRGFAELADGQVWAFGGSERAGGMASFVARVSPDVKVLYAAAAKARSPWEPTLAVTHVLDDQAGERILVVSPDKVVMTDKTLSSWKPLEGVTSGARESDAFLARGQAHLSKAGLLLTLARGGVMEVTGEVARRHLLPGQNPVMRPSEIVRLANGIAFYGDGGPIFYSDGGWHPLPDPIMPPPELMGPKRATETERNWVATTTIPIEGVTSYVVAKAGPPRRYIGHMHGLRDVVVTAHWDGAVLSVLGREELPIEPDDTFTTPDRQLWNVDDQGLWNLHGGHWRMVMRLAPEAASAHGTKIDSAGARAEATFKSAIGEPLHFANTFRPPFYGLPRHSASWALVRLDSNEAGGVPLIDEVPIKVDGRRLLLRDLSVWGNTKENLLLATNRGLCAYNVKFGNCDGRRPEGLDGQVDLFMRDGTKRLWLGGRGLWILRDDKQADAVHPWIPMLSDTQIATMAESPDGRLVIGTADRGSVFVTIPPGWFQRTVEEPIGEEPWEAARPHEPMFVDRSVVLGSCPGKQISDTAMTDLIASLRSFTQRLGGRTRVELEEQYEARADIAVRGADLEAILEGVQAVLAKSALKDKLSVQKRFGAPGSDSVEIAACR